jgi:hypothetical protein
MKAFLLAILMFTGFASFKKDRQADDHLIGKWKYLESVSGKGDGTKIAGKTPGMIGKYISFYQNGKVTGNYIKNGSYKITGASTIIISQATKSIKYNFEIRLDKLTLSQTDPIICDEGCADRFVKEH